MSLVAAHMLRYVHADFDRCRISALSFILMVLGRLSLGAESALQAASWWLQVRKDSK